MSVIENGTRKNAALAQDASQRNSAILNRRELLSVTAMTSYVAHNQNVPETRVRAFVEAAFDVTDLSGLRRDQFDRVIAFLVDLNCEMMTN